MNGWEKLEARVEPLRNGDVWNRVVAFSELIDFPLDDFQISLVVLAVRNRTVMHISAMRKIGKTHILGFLMLFLGFFGAIGVYCNHKKEFVEEFFEFVLPYARVLEELGYIRKIQPSNGFHNIHFTDGNSLYFRTRSAGFGRGFMKLDFVLWDEAQKSSAKQRKEISGALYPSKLKVQIYVGNPATLEDALKYPDSPFTMAKRQNSPSMIEFSGAEEYSEDLKLDAALLEACNPNASRLGDLEELLDSEWEQGKSHEEVAAELFGIWNLPEAVEKVDPYFSGAQIHRILSHPKQKSAASRFYLSVAMDFKAEEAYMVINDGTTIEVADVIPVTLGSVQEIADWIIANKHRFQRIFIMKTVRGAALIDSLKPVGRMVEPVLPGSFANSMLRFVRQVDDGTLRVVETAGVRAALGSFWIGHDPKNNAAIVRALSAEDISLVQSIMMAAVEDTVLNRIAMSNGQKAVEARANGPMEAAAQPEVTEAASRLVEESPAPAKPLDAMQTLAKMKADQAREKEMANG